MVDLLVEPKSLLPAMGDCVLAIENRNHVLNRLLEIRRAVIQASISSPAAGHKFP
jgi:hypothetical protein